MKIAKLTSIFFVVFLLLSTACSSQTPQATVQSTTEWYGIQAPASEWQAESGEEGSAVVSILSSRTIDSCKISLMTMDPLYTAGNPEGWTSSSEESETENLRVFRFTVRDDSDELQMVYYEIYPLGQTSNPSRLAYYQLDWGSDVDQCATAFQDLLETVDLSTFPDLPVAQG